MNFKILIDPEQSEVEKSRDDDVITTMVFGRERDLETTSPT